MKRKRRRTLRTLIILTLVPAGLTVAEDYDLDWWTIDGGGDMFATGGAFELSGTIGQPDANAVVMTGGNFELLGGFWAVTAVTPPGCPGDLNGDGRTDLADLGILLGDFGCVPPGPCVGDLNNDGRTDLADLGILLADFGCMP